MAEFDGDLTVNIFPDPEPIFILAPKPVRIIPFEERDITFTCKGLAVYYAGCGTHAIEVTMQLDAFDAARLVARIREQMEASLNET